MMPGSPWEGIRRDLLAMAGADVELRDALAADGALFAGYHPRMQAMHDTHASRLSAILATHRWPGESKVGMDGAEAAWLIVQRAIAQPELQRRALAALQQAAAAGDALPLHAAMLEDRIRCLEGRPQRYGTQFDWDEHGQLTPLPPDDPENIDRRRQALGLLSLADDLAVRRQAIASGPDRPPADWAARQQEMQAWCRSVGWR
jgi:hypothetical protein